MVNIRFGVDVVSDCVDTMCYQRRFIFWLFKWYTETHYSFKKGKKIIFSERKRKLLISIINVIYIIIISQMVKAVKLGRGMGKSNNFMVKLWDSLHDT